MAETNFFQLFKATWAQNGTTDRISATQYSTGWAYIGSLPPTVEQFNAVQQLTDQKLTWVYRHLEAVATLTGRELTAAGSDAISYAFENLNASRLTAGTVPVERLPERAPSMTVGAAAKWETPRNISISGGATARAKLFDGSADVTLEVTGLSMSAATGVLPPTHGGTGLDEIPAGNYLVGNGKGAMMSKTPDQVSEDLFISMRAIEALERYGLATDNAVEASNRLTDLDDPNTRSGLYVARGVPNPRNWLGSGFLLHRLYDSNGFQMGCALGSGILQFRERDRGVWKQPVRLANLDSPTFTGTPTAPTPALTDNSTRLATTAHVSGSVRAALDAYAATRGAFLGPIRRDRLVALRRYGIHPAVGRFEDSLRFGSLGDVPHRLSEYVPGRKRYSCRAIPRNARRWRWVDRSRFHRCDRPQWGRRRLAGLLAEPC